MEATLQLMVQASVYFVLFPGKRNPSPSAFFSMATSSMMIIIAAAKALIPQRLQNSQKESLMTIFRKVTWVNNVNLLLFVTLMIIFQLSIASLSVLFFGIEISGYFNASSSELEINISIAMNVFPMIYIICACLLVKFNCFIKFRQIEPKSLLISVVYFMTASIYSYDFVYTYVLFFFKEGRYATLIFLSSIYLCYLCLTFFFGVATFSVEKFTDIWDVDKFNSKHAISWPRLTGLICLTLDFIALQLLIIMLLYSFHVLAFDK